MPLDRKNVDRYLYPPRMDQMPRRQEPEEEHAYGYQPMDVDEEEPPITASSTRAASATTAASSTTAASATTAASSTASSCPSNGKYVQSCDRSKYVDENRKLYKTQARLFHPDKNPACIEQSKIKLQQLSEKCPDNGEIWKVRGGKKKTRKLKTRKTRTRKSRKARKSLRRKLHKK